MNDIVFTYEELLNKFTSFVSIAETIPDSGEFFIQSPDDFETVEMLFGYFEKVTPIVEYVEWFIKEDRYIATNNSGIIKAQKYIAWNNQKVAEPALNLLISPNMSKNYKRLKNNIYKFYYVMLLLKDFFSLASSYCEEDFKNEILAPCFNKSADILDTLFVAEVTLYHSNFKIVKRKLK